MTELKITELDYLPTRNGGEDQLHTHLTFKPSASMKESCGACAQLSNDFVWLRFNDAMANRERDFGTVETAIEYAKENIDTRTDSRTSSLRARDRAVA